MKKFLPISTFKIKILLSFLSLYLICCADSINPYNTSQQYIENNLFTNFAYSIETVINTSINQLTTIFSSSSSIGNLIQQLFVLLFVLETLWMLAKTYFESYNNALESMLTKFLIRVFSGSFFFYVVTMSTSNNQNILVSDIVSAVMYFAQLINSQNSAYYENGISFSTKLIDDIGNVWGANSDYAVRALQVVTDGISDPVVLFLIKLFTFFMICFAGWFIFKIIWNLILKFCEFIIVTYGVVFMVAFIGSEWTKNFFISYLRYIVSISIEFFLLIALVTFGQSNILNQQVYYNPQGIGYFVSLLQMLVYPYFFYKIVTIASRVTNAITAGFPIIHTGGTNKN